MKTWFSLLFLVFIFLSSPAFAGEKFLLDFRHVAGEVREEERISFDFGRRHEVNGLKGRFERQLAPKFFLGSEGQLGFLRNPRHFWPGNEIILGLEKSRILLAEVYGVIPIAAGFRAGGGVHALRFNRKLGSIHLPAGFKEVRLNNTFIGPEIRGDWIRDFGPITVEVIGKWFPRSARSWQQWDSFIVPPPVPSDFSRPPDRFEESFTSNGWGLEVSGIYRLSNGIGLAIGFQELRLGTKRPWGLQETLVIRGISVGARF